MQAVRKVAEAFRTGDPNTAWTAALAVLDPEMEMDMTRLPVPGLAGVYTGLEDVAGFWRAWLDAWGSLGEFEDMEIVEAGDQIVFWTTRQTMSGKGSGIAIDMPEYAWTATLRDGRIVKATIFMSRKEAFEAAGLEE